MSLSREAITHIPVESFMEAGRISLLSSPDINRLTNYETALLRKELKGYSAMADDVRHYEALQQGKDHGNAIHLGISRLGLAIHHWYYWQESIGATDPRIKEAHSWVSNLKQKRLRNIMRSYLAQEVLEPEYLVEDGDYYETAEVIATERECEAFMAFADYLEDRLLETDIEEDRAYGVSRGVLLGSVALREAVEMHEMEIHIRLSL